MPIFYEAPHRILDTLADVEAIFGAAQHVVVAREITKLHEEFLRGAVGDVRKTLADRASVRGEIVLLFAPAPVDASIGQKPKSIAAEVRELMKSQGLDEKDALKQVARARGIGKSDAYRELQRERGKCAEWESLFIIFGCIGIAIGIRGGEFHAETLTPSPRSVKGSQSARDVSSASWQD